MIKSMVVSTVSTGGIEFLDLYPNSSFAFSLMKIKSGVSAVIQVYRSDGIIRDFTAEEIIDGTLVTWGGGLDAYCHIWYDQSGNSRHALSYGARPYILKLGQLILENGLPCLDFANSKFLKVPTHSLVQPTQYFIVHNKKTHNDSYLFDSDTGDRQVQTDSERNYAGSQFQNAYPAEKLGSQVIFNARFSGATSKTRFNKLAEIQGNAGTQGSTFPVIGSGATQSGFTNLNGTVQEWVVWEEDKGGSTSQFQNASPAEELEIEENQNTRYKTAPTFKSITSVINFTSNFKWWGGSLASNGKIYAPPDSKGSVLVINTADDSNYEIPMYAGTKRFSGSVLAPNGFIYFIPFTGNLVGVFNPVTETATSIATITGSYKWNNGTLAPNGKIYCSPYRKSNILVIDTNTNTVSYIDISGLGVYATNSHSGGALAPNGKIYLTPFSSGSVIVIDTADDSLSVISGIAGGSYKYSGGVCLNDGNIVCFGYSRNDILLIDTTNDTVSYKTGLSGYNGGTLAPNGKAYSIMYAREETLTEFNPISNDTVYYPKSGNVNTECKGMVLAPNGNLYQIPYSGRSLKKIINVGAGISAEMTTMPSPISTLATSKYNKHSNCN
tara:strand:- start:25601 stop:27430 length:1830 start_codon:yes stop_codon:yes gene_type:complete